MFLPILCSVYLDLIFLVWISRESVFMSVSIDGNRDRLPIWVHNVYFILKVCFPFSLPPNLLPQCHCCCILLDLWFSLRKKSKLEHCKSSLSSPLPALKTGCHSMPDSFSYQSALFPGALGNWRWEQGTGRGEGPACPRLVNLSAHSLSQICFLSWWHSRCPSAIGPAESSFIRDLKADFKEVVGTGGGGA